MLKKIRLIALLLCGLMPGAFAQEGHPLVGTWQGEWGVAGSDGNFLTVIMQWDGNAITGLVNPGPGSTMLDTAQLDSTTWTVRLEMDLSDEAGNTHHLVAEGELQNLGQQTRSLSGTWSHESGSGTFVLTRQGGA